MECPPSWDISPLDDYETAESYIKELLAQQRPSVRILDECKIFFDGSARCVR
jgi:hypothetical protein